MPKINPIMESVIGGELGIKNEVEKTFRKKK